MQASSSPKKATSASTALAGETKNNVDEGSSELANIEQKNDGSSSFSSNSAPRESGAGAGTGRRANGGASVTGESVGEEGYTCCTGVEGVESETGSQGGRGAVRLLQVVGAVRTRYRYAVVLHFWDVVSSEWKE